MFKTSLAVAALIFSAAVQADAYDYCLTWRSWAVSANPSGTTKCGYVKRDDSTCKLNTTSNSNQGAACWETGADMVTLGCTVYDQVGSNLLGDIQWCERLWPDTCDSATGTCTKTYDFSYMATPDDGDGN